MSSECELSFTLIEFCSHIKSRQWQVIKFKPSNHSNRPSDLFEQWSSWKRGPISIVRKKNQIIQTCWHQPTAPRQSAVSFNLCPFHTLMNESFHSLIVNEPRRIRAATGKCQYFLSWSTFCVVFSGRTIRSRSKVARFSAEIVPNFLKVCRKPANFKRSAEKVILQVRFIFFGYCYAGRCFYLFELIEILTSHFEGFPKGPTNTMCTEKWPVRPGSFLVHAAE